MVRRVWSLVRASCSSAGYGKGSRELGSRNLGHSECEQPTQDDEFPIIDWQRTICGTAFAWLHGFVNCLP